jgi:hypothetical protein
MSAINNPSHAHVGGGQIAKTRRREDDCYLNAASLPVIGVNAVAILKDALHGAMRVSVRLDTAQCFGNVRNEFSRIAATPINER